MIHLLKSKAFYLSIAFSEDDAYFEGTGKYRETPAGSILYFSNLKEIEELFSPYFTILDLKKLPSLVRMVIIKLIMPLCKKNEKLFLVKIFCENFIKDLTFSKSAIF